MSDKTKVLRLKWVFARGIEYDNKLGTCLVVRGAGTCDARVEIRVPVSRELAMALGRACGLVLDTERKEQDHMELAVERAVTRS